MKKIAPGVYDDGRGGLHLDVGELLAAHGYADTPVNRARIIEQAREVLGDVVIETEAPIDPDGE